jgi:hypothetical protein
MLKPMLKNNNNLNALLSVEEISSEHAGQKIDTSKLVKYFIAPERQIYLRTIWAFRSILKKDPANVVLMPYAAMIETIANRLPVGKRTKEEVERDSEDEATTLRDIEVIKDAYVSGKQEVTEYKKPLKTPSIAQQRKNMMMNLLSRFSNDLASIFSTNGMMDEAEQFRSNIIAKLPANGIANIIKINPLTATQIDTSIWLLNYVWNHYDSRWANYNYDLIDVTLLNRVGAITNEELNSIKDEYEKNSDLTLLTDEDKAKPGMDTKNKFPLDKRMNPDYVHMLSLFFVSFMRKLGII